MTSPAIAIVTGANSGIGLAVSVALARAGFHVYAGMRDGACADALLATPAPPGAIHVTRMDVGDDDSVATAVASVLASTGGRVDVAVANAGYGTVVSVEEASLADYAAIMDVNFMGALRLVKAVLPAMRARGAGRILGTSSVGGVVGFPFGSPYAASKFAMEGFWESCHAEYKAAGVHFAIVRAPCGGLPLRAQVPPPVPFVANHLVDVASLCGNHLFVFFCCVGLSVPRTLRADGAGTGAHGYQQPHAEGLRPPPRDGSLLRHRGGGRQAVHRPRPVRRRVRGLLPPRGYGSGAILSVPHVCAARGDAPAQARRRRWDGCGGGAHRHGRLAAAHYTSGVGGGPQLL